MKKSANGFKIKRYVVLGLGIASIATIVGASALIRGNIKMPEILKEDPQAITEIIAKTPNRDNYTPIMSEDNIEVPVPKGYVASPDAEERYVNGEGSNSNRTHHGGFVIYEKNVGESDEQAIASIEDDIDMAQRERNQWVWIPISSEEFKNMYFIENEQIYGSYYEFKRTSYTLHKEYYVEPILCTNGEEVDHSFLKEHLEGISRMEFLREMKKEFYNMLKSVKTYKGFYIGRYETGNLSLNKPCIVKGNTDISVSHLYKSYIKCKSLSGANPVYTGIIYGIQFDETLKWLITSGEKNASQIGENSESWGNYKNAEFTFEDSNGVIRTKGTYTYATNGKTAFRVIPTGSSEFTKANNIYDLAGNMHDGTMGMNVGSNSRRYRVARGGYFGSNGSLYPAAFRYGSVLEMNSAELGCRVAMLIQTR